MSMYSVSCWRDLDKVRASFAYPGDCCQLMFPHTACRMILAPYDHIAPWTPVLRLYSVTQAISASIVSPIVLEMPEAVKLKIQLLSDLIMSMRSPKRVRMFGRSSPFLGECRWGILLHKRRLNPI
jgi:hypothetical protein